MRERERDVYPLCSHSHAVDSHGAVSDFVVVFVADGLDSIFDFVAGASHLVVEDFGVLVRDGVRGLMGMDV